MRELADGGDVGVVQAVGRAHAQFDLVHAHVEQLLQLDIFLAHPGWRFVELNHVLVKVNEDVEVMAQNRRGLEQGVVRGDTSVRPELEDELVVIGALTDAGVLDSVFHARDRREDGIDWNERRLADQVAYSRRRGKTAPNADVQFGFELVFAIEGADELAWGSGFRNPAQAECLRR